MVKSVISGQMVPKVGTDTQSWYRYPLYKGDLVSVPKIWVSVPIHSEGLVPVPMLPATLIFISLALLSLVFIHRLFRDLNKGFMGVHIRVYERENAPCLAPSVKQYSFNTINYSIAKSGEFVFD